MSEMWKPVVGYEGFYEVSDFGRVRAGELRGDRAGVLLKLTRMSNGYLYVNLNRPQMQSKMSRVHRLVVRAFLGESSLPIVRHLDGDQSNNRLDNLAYGTQHENAIDRVVHGRGSKPRTHCFRGHELTPENTISRRHSSGRTMRNCRTCVNAAKRLQSRKAFDASG